MVQCLQQHFYNKISPTTRSLTDTERLSCYHSKRICFWIRGNKCHYNIKNVLYVKTWCLPQKRNMLPYKKISNFMFEIKTFSSLSTQKTLKKGKRWHAPCQYYTLVSGRTSYTHRSFSKRAVTVSDFVHNETWVFQCWIVCVYVCGCHR